MRERGTNAITEGIMINSTADIVRRILMSALSITTKTSTSSSTPSSSSPSPSPSPSSLLSSSLSLSYLSHISSLLMADLMFHRITVEAKQKVYADNETKFQKKLMQQQQQQQEQKQEQRYQQQRDYRKINCVNCLIRLRTAASELTKIIETMMVSIIVTTLSLIEKNQSSNRRRRQHSHIIGNGNIDDTYYDGDDDVDGYDDEDKDEDEDEDGNGNTSSIIIAQNINAQLKQQQQQQQQRLRLNQYKYLNQRCRHHQFTQQQQQHQHHKKQQTLQQHNTLEKCYKHLSVTFLPYIVVLLVVCIVNTSSIEAVAADTLHGYLPSCKNEGEAVQIEIENSKCFKCACQNGFVKCNAETCPSLDYCYQVEKKRDDKCCIKCKGCIFRGIQYGSGSEWKAPDNPCKVYKCVGGVITETIIRCYTQCSDDQLIKPKTGECCPTCHGCKFNGQIVEEGQTVASIDDRCLECQCTANTLKCTKKACPVLQCPLNKQLIYPDECCPRCKERRDLIPLRGKCLLGNTLLADGEQFKVDHCTNCTCVKGTSVCERQTCPIVECSTEYQENDGCCSRCVMLADMRGECIYKGVTYQENDSWNVDSCSSCRCLNGNIRCSKMICPILKCRSNEQLILAKGDCCKRCVETAGSCTVFGDPHFKTFDGKFYSFQGSCKYLLTADCTDYTFSIRLTNEGRNTNRSAWTKTITLKLNDTRITLGQKLRVKVNGTRVIMPYKQHPVIHLERLNNTVILKTALGINMEWDGDNFLQVEVPALYKGRLCGLCGNYNNVARDDLIGRDGINYSTEVWRFAHSWKVGGPKACSRQFENIAVQPTCKNRKPNAFCRPLRDSEVFGNCDNSLNPINFIESCKMDVCECPHGMCHCDSFAAYAHECQRLGVNVPDWRTITNCPWGLIKRNITASISELKHNPHYGDLRFLERPSIFRKKHHRKHKHYDDNLSTQRDFITKHVPKSLLMSKYLDRTPPPLH